MQGIPFFDFKSLQKLLDEMMNSAEQAGGTEDLEKARAYKQSLNDIYAQYSISVKTISEQTKNFSRIKLNIRHLLIKHKRKLKQESRKPASTKAQS